MNSQAPSRRWFTLAPALAIFALAGCVAFPGAEAPDPDPERTGISSDDALVAASAPTTDLVTMTDPVDNSFTVGVPAGWDSVAYAAGGFEAHREVVSTISPDGGTVLFMGDPTIPNYWNPATADDLTRWFADNLDSIELRSYTPATQYLGDWVQQKFSGLDGFELQSVDRDVSFEEELRALYVAAGLTVPPLDAAQVSFGYQSSYGTINAVVFGVTIDFGAGWYTDMRGISTNRDPQQYVEMLDAMAESKVTSPEWLARRDQLNEQIRQQQAAFTQQLIDQHNANMAWIQQSANAHQARMEAIWAAGDASMASYYDRMDAMDHNQQQFLNYINEEETVAGPSGQTWQVATGATNYYVNPVTGDYVGGDINFDDQDLLALGLQPDDYQQVTIVR